MTDAPTDSGGAIAEAADGSATHVIVFADDLIWSTRLASIVRAAGAMPSVVASEDRFAAALPAARAVIVDLAARANTEAAIRESAALGLPVIGVGPHADIAARKVALAAGASRVFAYSKLYEDGPRVVAEWLGHLTASTRDR